MTLILVTFCICCLITKTIKSSDISSDAADKSAHMLSKLRQEIHRWVYLKCRCESIALHGIQKLMQLNSTHPIKDGVSLIYFMKKANCTENPMFGSKRVRWTYHCCIGFADTYLIKDWFIDLSYHCMIEDIHLRIKRLIEKEEYLP